jgi:hypothetical protein
MGWGWIRVPGITCPGSGSKGQKSSGTVTLISMLFVDEQGLPAAARFWQFQLLLLLLFTSVLLISDYYITSTTDRHNLNHTFKGTVSRDFLLLVFFMNLFSPSPRVPR